MYNMLHISQNLKHYFVNVNFIVIIKQCEQQKSIKVYHPHDTIGCSNYYQFCCPNSDMTNTRTWWHCQFSGLNQYLDGCFDCPNLLQTLDGAWIVCSHSLLLRHLSKLILTVIKRALSWETPSNFITANVSISRHGKSVMQYLQCKWTSLRW